MRKMFGESAGPRASSELDGWDLSEGSPSQGQVKAELEVRAYAANNPSLTHKEIMLAVSGGESGVRPKRHKMIGKGTLKAL